jgi:7,8-dihydropterin-6-yl-methyl-4-(beta-D-ribofuranosyl)aminobenzene 5'-phosphate synthase
METADFARLGYSDVFIENAARMGIDLGRVTDIVLSHGHNDHTGGLPAFFARFTQQVRLFAHPGALLPKRVEGELVGSPYALDQLPEQVQPRLITKPQVISEHVTVLAKFRASTCLRKIARSVNAKRLRMLLGGDALGRHEYCANATGGVFVGTVVRTRALQYGFSQSKSQTERVSGVLGGFIC